MTKKPMILTGLTALVAGLGLGTEATSTEQDALEKRVQALETKLAEGANAIARVEAIEEYLAAQSAADAAVIKAVDEAVDQGFTSGINFKSRETLVAAWKARAEAAAANLPAPKKAPQVKVDPRLERRRR